MTWVPDRRFVLGGHRLVTKAFAVLGTMRPIFEPELPKAGRETTTTVKKVVSGRVSKRSLRSNRQSRSDSMYMAL